MTAGQAGEGFAPTSLGRIHYVKRGSASGTPVILLHSIGTGIWTWDGVVEQLEKQFTCYSFDMLGHGQSDKPGKDIGIPGFTIGTAEAIRALGITRAHIVGNSVGGFIGVELAALYPELVDRLVMADSPAWFLTGAADRLKAGEATYDEKGLRKPSTLEQMKAGGVFLNPKQEWVDKINASRDQAGIWYKKTMDCLMWWDIRSRLPFIKAATLVMWGAHDIQMVGEDILLNNIPNASKAVLAEAGHISPVEDPKGFASAVVDFLK